MRILELYAGTGSIGRAAREHGHEVFSIDNDPQFNCDLTIDVLKLHAGQLPWKPDIIWASPPCTTFSVASLGHHWTGGKGAYIPKTEACKVGLLLLEKAVKIISALQPCIWFIENPRGVMRKVIRLSGLKHIRHTVTYCQYGDTRMKPTDIWTNCEDWTPRPMCKNGAPCHESAPRGSRTGTQGLKNAKLRSIIPPQLCEEIIHAIL